MEALFFMLFEIATPTTTYTIVSGEPGVAKSMRFGRFKASMSPGLVIQGGNSSARAGQQGNNDAQNGCFVYTDEMISKFEDNDGNEDIEKAKQAATERCITYQKATPVKSDDGLEGHATATFRTWVWRVMAMGSNGGGGYSKGDEEPSNKKLALINRSQAVHVRTHEGRSRLPSEFETHQARPQVQRRRTALRQMINISLLARMMMLNQAHLRPDMTVAQRLWQVWDKALVEKFGLVGIQRRRNDKRTEDCVTASVWTAVWEVFGYKQTSVLFPEVSKRDAKGNLPRFHPRQLYYVFQVLQPTHEMIQDAWTRNLELSISTSRTGTNVMSMLAEAHHFHFTDLLRRTLDENKRFNVIDYVKPYDEGQGIVAAERKKAIDAAAAARGLTVEQLMKQNAGAAAGGAAPGAASSSRLEAGSSSRELVHKHAYLPKAEPAKTRCQLFHMYAPAGEDGDTPDLREIQRASSKLSRRREATAEYRKRCLNSSSNGRMVQDLEQMITDAGASRPLHAVEGGGSASSQIVDHGPASSTTLGERFSCVAPDLLFTSLFYSTRNLLHWSINEYAGFGKTSAFHEQYNEVAGTRADRQYVQVPSTSGKKTKYDFGWVRVIETSSVPEGETEAKLKGCSSYKDLAKHLNGVPTQARFSYHEEAIKDALFLLGHNKENSRMIPLMPVMSSGLDVDSAMIPVTRDDPNEPSNKVVKPHVFKPLDPSKVESNQPFVDASDPGAWAKPRHPSSLVEDSDLQRRVDGLIKSNRLFAASIVASNKISQKPPIRIKNSECQVNAGILTDHCALLAEATLAAASIPGLKNSHEKLPKSAEKPVGLSIPDYNTEIGLLANFDKDPGRFRDFGNETYPTAAVQRHGESTTREIFGSQWRHGAPKRARAEAGEERGDGAPPPKRVARANESADAEMADADTAVVRGAKRKRSDGDGDGNGEDTDWDEDGNDLRTRVYALPYAHDIVNIHLGRSMAMMLYDDDLEKEKKFLVAKYGQKYGFTADIEHAEMTLPFTGFLERGRQLLSIPRRTKPLSAECFAPLKDPEADHDLITKGYVSMCLQRPADDHDVALWAAQRAGSSQDYGIKGDVFSQSVLRRHSLAALQARGMIASFGETAAMLVRFRSSQLFSRVMEYACKSANSPYSDNSDMQGVRLAQPNSYRAQEAEEMAAIALRAKKLREHNDASRESTIQAVPASAALNRDVGSEVGDFDDLL